MNNVVLPVNYQDNEIMCEICDYAENWVEAFLNKNGTEQKIDDFVVNDVCPKLPAEIAGMCESYAPMVLSYVLQKVDSALENGKLCAPLCGSNTKKQLIAPPAETILQGNGSCNFCEQAAAKVHSFLSQPGEIDKIINFAKQLCDYIPDKDDCIKKITGFGPMALDYILGATADPQSACEMIHLCE